MTVREFYDNLKSDYSETLRRLGNEDRMRRFLLKFADDESFYKLKTSLEDGIYEEAFRCAHSLKGIAMNLGLTELACISSELTEALRGKVFRDDLAELYGKTETEYKKTVAAIRSLA